VCALNKLITKTKVYMNDLQLTLCYICILWQVVQGLDLALPLMDVGEVALLEMGPRFAYGTLGREPDVPPDATVVYTVELLSSELEPDVEMLPAAKRKDIG
jgi:FK506-binding protein 8